MIYLGTALVIALALIIRSLIVAAASSKEPDGLHSDKVIIGNGWGIYDGEYVEGRYDI